MAKVNFSLRKTNTQNIYPCLHLQKAFITHFAYVLNVNIYDRILFEGHRVSGTCP